MAGVRGDAGQPLGPSRGRRLLLGAVTLGLVLLAVEAIASTLLLYRYRSLEHDVVLPPERGFLSTLVLAGKLLERVGLASSPCRGAFEYASRSEPGPIHRPDPLLGYALRPGRYTHWLMRRRCGGAVWEGLPLEVTIEPDGSRWTGPRDGRARRRVWAFGESWLFGYGVHDDQTWAARLQALRPDLEVHLFAAAGWSLGQALLQLRAVRDRIDPEDIVILGYAGFLDDRNPVAPSRLRWIAYWNRTRGIRDAPNVALPRFGLGPDGRLTFDHIEQDCTRNGGYCDRPDPDPLELSRLSAALVEAAARETPARFLLLRYGRGADNPVYGMLDPAIEVVPALDEDFPAFVRDDVAGFDDHPGPYWHHAVARRVAEWLARPGVPRRSAEKPER